jgi:hypothetical protein
MMKAPRFNIAAAYDLAESATAALKGRYDEIYFKDHIEIASDDFWQAALSPQKRTLLHRFLMSWESFRWGESFSECLEDHALVCDYLVLCEISPPKWFDKTCLLEREDRAWQLIESAFPKATNAAFNLLFQDRGFLVLFQNSLRDAVNEFMLTTSTSSAITPIPRCTYIPEWLKKGIFHRDRGLCQCCGRDVSGVLNLDGVLHLDHLLPLFVGGTNDPTNFQLLCRECNLSKGGRQIDAQSINHSFW